MEHLTKKSIPFIGTFKHVFNLIDIIFMTKIENYVKLINIKTSKHIY